MCAGTDLVSVSVSARLGVLHAGVGFASDNVVLYGPDLVLRSTLRLELSTIMTRDVGEGVGGKERGRKGREKTRIKSADETRSLTAAGPKPSKPIPNPNPQTTEQ